MYSIILYGEDGYTFKWELDFVPFIGLKIEAENRRSYVVKKITYNIRESKFYIYDWGENMEFIINVIVFTLWFITRVAIPVMLFLSLVVIFLFGIMQIGSWGNMLSDRDVSEIMLIIALGILGVGFIIGFILGAVIF